MPNRSTNGQPEFDAIVIGTGFAGAVTAARLVQAGQRICVLERGRRYEPDDFPKYPTERLFMDPDDDDSYAPPPDFSRWIWGADSGIYDARDLGDVISLQAAAYGGGSIIYANVHLRPPDEVFRKGWPDGYQKKYLEPYFDLAAYMLQVAPIPVRLAKTAQLQRAEAILSQKHGSGQNEEPFWFRVPLAVNFGQIGAENMQNREQGVCDMRARCCQGCSAKAKNTLDFNYLAIVEDAAEGNSALASIKTMAEVKSITPVSRPNETHYEVGYQSRLHGPEGKGDAKSTANPDLPTVSARYVFICAGSVNTTQLLFENRDELWPGQKPDRNDVALGSHYFPNADSLSVVFDCDESHETDYGPTITSALLYNQPPDDGLDTLLMEISDGRVPDGSSAKPEIGDRVVGSKSKASAVLAHNPLLDWGDWEDRAKNPARGELVLRDQKGEFSDDEDLEFRAPGDETPKAQAVVRSTDRRQNDWILAEDGGFPPDIRPLIGAFRSPLWLCRNRYLEHDQIAHRIKAPARPPQRQRLRAQTFADAIGGTPRNAVLSGTPLKSIMQKGRAETFLGSDTDAKEDKFATDDLLGIELLDLLPDWLKTALKDSIEELTVNASAFAEPLLGMLLDNVALAVSSQIDASDLLELTGAARTASKEEIDDRKFVLVRGMLRLAVQLILNSEAGLARRATNTLFDGAPKNLSELLGLTGDLLLWAIAHRSVQGHTGMILTMGRDAHRGALSLDADGRLTAKLPNPQLTSTRKAQERLSRAIAKDAWHGELRTNPLWSVLGKRITVHSQGGCPMGSDIKNSVTGRAGEVHGCKGLYVMDAAAFPTSVGVNPSATITAVAEYKIECFIQNVLAKGGDWSAPEKSDAEVWAKKRRDELDPLAKRMSPSQFDPPPVLGLSFSETMRGYFAAPTAQTQPVDWEDVDGFAGRIREFDSAETDSLDARCKIEVDLTVKISNLNDLISPPSELNPAKMRISGELGLQGWPSEGQNTNVELLESSYVQLFLPGRNGKSQTRFFRYQLFFAHGGTDYTVQGLKIIHDGPSVDVWRDTSTLYFDIFARDQNCRSCPWRGIMRIPVQEFLNSQLQSFMVTGTDDPARKTWAIAAFGKYFFGHLAEVYLPEFDRAVDVLKRLLNRTHV